MQLYRKFRNIEEAKDLTDLLKKEGIPFKINENTDVFDLTMTGNLPSDIQLLLNGEDFVKVSTLYERLLKEYTNEVDDDHYLYDFTNDELIEVLEKKYEWSEFDVVLARQILTQRGIEISQEKLDQLERDRIEKEKLGQASPKAQLIVGYISAFLGGLLGIIIGWYLWKHKKSLPNGEEIPVYQIDDRMHGKTMFIIGLIVSFSFTIALILF